MRIMRKGFTLVELLIVIVVIGVLAAMMVFASNEAVSTAKASNIIANLTTLKKAVLAWHMDNLHKVEPDGRVKIGDDRKPIQEWGDDKLHLSDYLGGLGTSGINLNTKYNDSNTGKTNTDLKKGYYGVCDGGNGKRTKWYIGYRFMDNEGGVREKLSSRQKTSGIFFGTADAHEDHYNDNSAAVWMRVL